MFILASSSPRRLQLLQQIGINPDQVVPADIDESALPGELPAVYARRMAWAKAQTIAQRYPQQNVLAADTVVALGRRILPKAEDRGQARACLMQLSGRRHKVLGGVCLFGSGVKPRVAVVSTTLRFKRLGELEIQAYLDSEEWLGKAGGYAIQGRAASFIDWINGCYFNIVGLPLSQVYKWLSDPRTGK